MHSSRLVLVLGLLTGCVHNWQAYEPADAAVAEVSADVVTTMDVVHPDVPMGVDVPIVRDVPRDIPMGFDVPRDIPMGVDVPIARDVVDVQPLRDVVDVPIMPDVPVIDVSVVDVPTVDAVVVDVPVFDVPTVDVPSVDVPVLTDTPCGMSGDPCCFGRFCRGGLVCGTDTICASMCTGTATACSSICVDTDTDPMNCGSCGNVCTGMRRNCAGGMCVR